MTEKKSPAKPKRKAAKPKARAKKATKKKVPVRRRKKLQESLKKLSVRQMKYRKNRLAGMSIFAAAVAAGYSKSYARSTASRLLEKQVKASILEELEMAGGTDAVQCRELVNIALNATQTKYSESGGFYDVPDYNTRKSTWELIAKLKKQLQPSSASLIPADGYTKLTVVVERDSNSDDKEPAHAGAGNNPHAKAKSRISLTN